MDGVVRPDPAHEIRTVRPLDPDIEVISQLVRSVVGLAGADTGVKNRDEVHTLRLQLPGVLRQPTESKNMNSGSEVPLGNSQAPNRETGRVPIFRE